MAAKQRLLVTLLLVGSFLLMSYSLVVATPVWFSPASDHANLIRALLLNLTALISFTLFISLIDLLVSNGETTFFKAYQETWTNLCSVGLIIITILSLRQIVTLVLQIWTNPGQNVVNQFYVAALVFISASTVLVAIVIKLWRKI